MLIEYDAQLLLLEQLREQHLSASQWVRAASPGYRAQADRTPTGPTDLVSFKSNGGSGNASVYAVRVNSNKLQSASPSELRLRELSAA